MYKKYCPDFYKRARDCWAEPRQPVERTVIWPEKTELRGSRIKYTGANKPAATQSNKPTGIQKPTGAESNKPAGNQESAGVESPPKPTFFKEVGAPNPPPKLAGTKPTSSTAVAPKTTPPKLVQMKKTDPELLAERLARMESEDSDEVAYIFVLFVISKEINKVDLN